MRPEADKLVRLGMGVGAVLGSGALLWLVRWAPPPDSAWISGAQVVLALLAALAPVLALAGMLEREDQDLRICAAVWPAVAPFAVIGLCLPLAALGGWHPEDSTGALIDWFGERWGNAIGFAIAGGMFGSHAGPQTA